MLQEEDGNVKRQQRVIHAPFLNIIFIAISYWVEYRTGLHLLTL